jgi:hypothetical protein
MGIEKLRKGGGRGYALATFAIGAVTMLAGLYMVMLFLGLIWYGTPLTPELASPVTIGLVVIGGLGGATQLPNVAESWTGNRPTPPEG